MDFESTLSGHNLAFLEALYEAYQRDPNSVDADWIPVLRELEQRNTSTTTPGEAPPILKDADSAEAEQIALQSLVDRLIDSYRLHGHTAAQIDPLGRDRATPEPGLDPAYYGLREDHMDREFSAGTLMPRGRATLREIVARLRRTYTQHIGVEYWHLPNVEQRNWLQARMEGCENHVIPSKDEQRRLFEAMVSIDNTDNFIHSKFLGAKRFSISGAESMIAMLDCIIEESGDVGIDEVVIGMAHRGRLNVLMNILGKAIEDVFSEFGKADAWAGLGSGDVKYHMGYFRHHTTTQGKPMYLALAFNPSHLEAISPVNQGRVRGKQDQISDAAGDRVIGVTLHGDAAFAGQGVVQETLNLARLPGYQSGGSIRIVINNQVGFTTDPSDSRSTSYATDVAHMLEIPIFHVNGDDVEAAAYVARLAVDFRQRFHRDVIIDLVCYRRFGHNEGDDPTFTQPAMYSLIHAHKSVRELYEAEIRRRGTLSPEECDAVHDATNANLGVALEKAKEKSDRKEVHMPMHGVWADYRGGPDSADNEVDTKISRELFDALGPKITRSPEDFQVHRRLSRILGDQATMYTGEQPLNWAAAELMAYASLLDSGVNIRMTGQDTRRGTFSHRHAVFSDANTGATWTPLANLSDDQGHFEIYNSPLSEFAVLGFEFGYSLISPAALVIWEAQFGDFCNGAQVILDNFLTTCEDKWNRLSGLVMMLPHGYEGQGPEHSSARLERFLQLAAEDNIQVVNLTTPAQEFHILRRQVIRNWRKPLIMMTPKSLLRFRPSFSSIEEICEGKFQRLIDDPTTSPEKVKRLMFCSGKVFYDLIAQREELGTEDVAIIRVEQLYPLAVETIDAIAARYPNADDLMWVQEEPRNMGAWTYISPILRECLGQRLGDPVYVGRRLSASPATGHSASHELERKLLLEAAFADL